MKRVAAAVGLGVLGGLAWWAPMVSLGALPVALGLDDPRDPDGPAVWAGGAILAAAIALGTAPWLAVMRPSEERVILSVCFGLFLSGVPRLRSAGRWALVGALASMSLGVALHLRWLPGGWLGGAFGGIAAAAGLVIPGLPCRSFHAALLLAIGGWVAWWWLGSRARSLWLGLAVGSAVAAWPFQVAAPPRIDGWSLGTATEVSEIAGADPRFFPRELQSPTLPAGLGALAGTALGVLIGQRRGQGSST